MTTKYMRMPDVQTGKERNYVDQLSQCFSIIDSHDHFNSGKFINQAAISFNSLDFIKFSILNTNYINFQNQTSSVGVNLSLYVKNRNLYFIDGVGNEIQLTQNGFINSVSTLTGGFIGDYVQSGASCVYDDLLSEYDFFGPNQDDKTTLQFDSLGTISEEMGVLNINSNTITCNYARPIYYDDTISPDAVFAYIGFDENKNMFMNNFFKNDRDFDEDLINFIDYFGDSNQDRKNHPYQINTMNTKYISYENNNDGQYLYKLIAKETVYDLTCILKKSYVVNHAEYSTTDPHIVTLSTIDVDGIEIIGARCGAESASEAIVITCLDGIVMYAQDNLDRQFQYEVYYTKRYQGAT